MSSLIDNSEISPLWLAAVLTHKGSLGASLKKDGRVVPFLKLGDTCQEKISFLNDQLGGTRPALMTENFWYWQLNGSKVANVIERTGPYVLNHPYFKYFYNWENLSREDQVSRTLQARIREQYHPSVQQYADLISLPNFAAGVIDWEVNIRQAPTTIRGKKYEFLRSEFFSYDKDFLNAFQEVFGGHVFEHTKAGSLVEYKGVSYVTSRDTFAHIIGEEETEAMIKSVLPYLKFRKEQFSKLQIAA